MVDQEVEDTLREIRERVLAESAQALPAEPLSSQPNGAAAVVAESAPLAQANGRASGEALARLHANLSTTERAWSRLPPLVSYRRGFVARFELWLKSQVKRAAHWFTWEQVNFNSAVHHALGDAREALSAHEQRLAAHEQKMAAHEQKMAAHEQALARAQAETAALRASFEQLRAESDSERARLSGLYARLGAGVEQLRAEQHAFAEAARADQRALADGLRDEQRAQAQARAAEILNEMRERADRLLEEQRVCFKQLSLEAGEAAVMHDRARRQIEARLEALEQNRER
jgi:septal ring factor EnvC (AmiA/AmiB activator)